ncbi:MULTISPECIES: lytic murein transglycosylase [unclassified Roseitalea]|uniref:lytic murein transglycosylase n=1 Tax=unclassified Roseitalea TaxID=2639107 RepID=UPI00273D2A00|nr:MULTISPECIES: lytic murein transglycosylase [unclassified Roseitalea]
MIRPAPTLSLAALAVTVLAGTAAAQPCGGDFASWRAGTVEQARAQGVGQAGLDALASARTDPDVIRRDRSQGIFTLDFLTFSQRLISQNRMDNGRANLRRYSDVFERARSQYGVAPEIIAAFWAFETDYGAVQGDFNTLNALATLAHDCRRPELFRPQLMALARLIDLGVVPRDITGAWAGEIGQIQVLPEDYLTKGQDGDGDGRIRLKTSTPDAIMTAANFLASLGWQANQPWLVEVSVPEEMDWFDAGIHRRLPVSEWMARGVRARNGTLDTSLEASLLLPKGRKGVAFLAYPNFNVLLEWNQSLTYVTTAAYFATRLAGAPRYDTGNPDTALTEAEMKQLQRKLAARGHDVGEIDGILGAGTRAAVRLEQQRLGMPADAWPTQALLAAL